MHFWQEEYNPEVFVLYWFYSRGATEPLNVKSWWEELVAWPWVWFGLVHSASTRRQNGDLSQAKPIHLYMALVSRALCLPKWSLSLVPNFLKTMLCSNIEKQHAVWRAADVGSKGIIVNSVILINTKVSLHEFTAVNVQQKWDKWWWRRGWIDCGFNCTAEEGGFNCTVHCVRALQVICILICSYNTVCDKLHCNCSEWNLQLKHRV